MSDSIIDPFHRDLFRVLSAQIDERMVLLAQGSAGQVTGDTATTAEKYAAQTSYIRALNDVLDKCKGLELERYGARPGAEQD